MVPFMPWVPRCPEHVLSSPRRLHTLTCRAHSRQRPHSTFQKYPQPSAGKSRLQIIAPDPPFLLAIAYGSSECRLQQLRMISPPFRVTIPPRIVGVSRPLQEWPLYTVTNRFTSPTPQPPTTLTPLTYQVITRVWSCVYVFDYHTLLGRGSLELLPQSHVVPLTRPIHVLRTHLPTRLDPSLKKVMHARDLCQPMRPLQIIRKLHNYPGLGMTDPK